MKAGDPTFVLGRVERALGNAQFSVKVSKTDTVIGAPLGVFTTASCLIAPQHVVIMEPAERKTAIHTIVGRIDTRKDIKALRAVGIIPSSIFESTEDEVDDLFEDGRIGDEEDEEGGGGGKRDKKPRHARAYAPSRVFGAALLKETADAEAVAPDDGETAAPSKRKRRTKAAAAAQVPARVKAAAAAASPEPAIAEEPEAYTAGPVKERWDDDDAVDIDAI